MHLKWVRTATPVLPVGRSLPPHPSPLPWGEGARMPVFDFQQRAGSSSGGQRGSLSPKEGVGVRGKVADSDPRLVEFNAKLSAHHCRSLSNRSFCWSGSEDCLIQATAACSSDSSH